MQSNWAAELATSAPAGPILELCAGAGHIGLLAAVLSGRRLVQVDSSPAACEFARQNADAAGARDQVDIRCGDIEEAVRPDERFPLVIADPPYIPRAEVARFPDDPLTAIDGGQSGLDVVVACLDVAGRHVMDDGACLLQVRGPSQVAAVRPLAHARALVVDSVRVADDERAVALLRPTSADRWTS
ncbi:MAG: methyltransferase domain-containing protein [Acidimicrobiia bacterium]|nr:methyltransferase domain-containing protein [Acidimicrobiia bacterium]